MRHCGSSRRPGAAGQREVGDHAQAVLLAERLHALLDVAIQQVVEVLTGHELREVVRASRPLRLRHLPLEEVRRADVPHLALAHEVVQRAHRLLDGRAAVRRVHLIDIDVVRLQPSQRSLARIHGVLARRAAVVRSRPCPVAELRRHDHAVAPTLERSAEVLLRPAREVRVCGVEVGNTGVDRRIDDALRAVDIDLVAERVTTKANGRNLQAGLAKLTKLHVFLRSVRRENNKPRLSTAVEAGYPTRRPSASGQA